MHVICGRIYIKLKQTRPIDHFICDIRLFTSLISEILNSILGIVLGKKPSLANNQEPKNQLNHFRNIKSPVCYNFRNYFKCKF